MTATSRALPLTRELLAAAAQLPTATLHEAAGKIGALPAALKPVRPGMSLAGPALPVLSPPGDNLWLHRAIDAASDGEVLVVAFGPGAADPRQHGHWGEVMAVAAAARGIAGLVIDGGIRDGDQLAERGFATFASSVCIRGTAKDPHGIGAVGEAVVIGGVTVNHGDLVVGDADGVVVIPAAAVDIVVREARRREDSEQMIFDRLESGESTIDVYRLPAGGDA
ncbi:MAG: RraA family protein [Frankia sp.]